MNFKMKMRLIGFYNKPNQDMQAEKEAVEDADKLRVLLGVSFSSLTQNVKLDRKFKSVLQGNTVFILKGEDNHLYAYYPLKKLARISHVIYNKKDVNPVPLRYKSWFVPGEDISVTDYRTEKEPRWSVTTSGRDFFVTKGSQTLPLKWDQDLYISIKDLVRLINDPWVVLIEYETSNDCGGCDGYDNSDNSHGRRYICNNRCFNYRYDVAFAIRTNNELIRKEMQPLAEKMERMNKPFTTIAPDEFESLQKAVDSFSAHSSKVFAYTSEVPEVEQFLRHYQEVSAKMQGRRDLDTCKSLVICINNKVVHRVDIKQIKLDTEGILFWKGYYIETIRKTYDAYNDQLCTFRYEIVFDSKAERIVFEQLFNAGKINTLKLKSENNDVYKIEN